MKKMNVRHKLIYQPIWTVEKPLYVYEKKY